MTPSPPSIAAAAVDWTEVVVRCDAVDAEAVADALREGGAAGVAIEPAILVSDDADFVYEERMDVPWTVRATLAGVPPTAVRRALRRRLAAVTTMPLSPLRFRPVRPEQWSDAWKRFFGVLHVGRRTVIRPTWEPYAAAPDDVVIDLDPGTAFGTGQHETTRLCLQALEDCVHTGDDVLDVGAGSGILAIAAAKHGARHVIAVDVDASTVAVVVENAQRNGVAAVIEAAAGSLGADWPWPDRRVTSSANVVVANISSHWVTVLLPAIADALRPGGAAVLSGFLVRDADAIAVAATAAGLDVTDRLLGAEWACVVARALRSDAR